MARKNRAERIESRLVWQGIRKIRDAKVRHNMANPGSELLAPNVIPNRKGQMDLGRALTEMKERFKSCRVSQTIIKNDRKIATGMLVRKYKLNDADMYGTLDNLPYRPGATLGEKPQEAVLEAQVRTGTTKLGPQFRPVGLPDSIPKDGGKRKAKK